MIITAATNSNAPIDLSEAITRDRGIICMIGVTQMTLDRRPFYERELTFKIARSYGPGRYDPSYEEAGVDYPIGYVRFTEGRNVEEFIRLLATKRMDFFYTQSFVCVPLRNIIRASDITYYYLICFSCLLLRFRPIQFMYKQ